MERAEEVAMLYGLEALAEMKSGPRELQLYHQQVVDEEKRMTDETTAAPVVPAPRRKRSPNKPKVAEHGAITIKLELSASDAEALLGFLIRTGLTQAAHQTVDALAKAQRNGE